MKEISKNTKVSPRLFADLREAINAFTAKGEHKGVISFGCQNAPKTIAAGYNKFFSKYISYDGEICSDSYDGVVFEFQQISDKEVNEIEELAIKYFNERVEIIFIGWDISTEYDATI